MATSNNITLFSPRNKCRVAAARAALAAGVTDDAAFTVIQDRIAQLPATSVAGIEAKFDALCVFLDAIEDLGVADSYVSWDAIDALRSGIKASLIGLQH